MRYVLVELLRGGGLLTPSNGRWNQNQTWVLWSTRLRTSMQMTQVSVDDHVFAAVDGDMGFCSVDSGAKGITP